MNSGHDFIQASWPAPAHIRAGTTWRTGGVSRAPYDTLNLGAHTGDVPADVAQNRSRLTAALGLPGEPSWLDQIHATTVACLDTGHTGPADAAVATRHDRVAVVMTADCLPVVFTDKKGSCWGAAHAGWRGLASGVLEATVAALPARPGDLLAWLGPAIGPDCFEVGPEVRAAFVAVSHEDEAAFVPASRAGKFMADIYALARARLRRVGLTEIHGGGLCTVCEPRCYSYRRDRGRTGRMATLVWSRPAIVP